MMKVAIDGRALTGRFTGDRTYWRNLLASLAELESDAEFVVVTRLQIPVPDRIASSRVSYCTVPGFSERTWTLRELPKALTQIGADVVHTQYTVPIRSPCPIATTVHDITFKLFPDWYRARDRILLNATMPASMRRSHFVITVSESSRKDILATYHLPADKVVATPNGVPREFLSAAGNNSGDAAGLASIGLSGPYLFAVGVLQPRKNFAHLARSVAQARNASANVPQLVIAGKPGWGGAEEAIRSAANASRPTDWLRLPGYVPDNLLPALYRNALFHAHPALYEGFGIPPLEAMASGCPTLVSNRPAMPEVVGDAGLVVPLETQAWSDAIIKLSEDREMRARLAEAGRERAKQFDWRSTAQKTLEVYQRCATLVTKR